MASHRCGASITEAFLLPESHEAQRVEPREVLAPSNASHLFLRYARKPQKAAIPGGWVGGSSPFLFRSDAQTTASGLLGQQKQHLCVGLGAIWVSFGSPILLQEFARPSGSSVGRFLVRFLILFCLSSRLLGRCWYALLLGC